MDNIKIFENPDFGKVRVVDIKGEPWFAGKDVAAVLGYTDTFGAIKKHVDDDDKQNCQNSSFESPRGLTFINESGLYSLIISSKLPKAKEFKRWVTSEVLPSIRRTGGYQIPRMSATEIIAASAVALVEHERRIKSLESSMKQTVDRIYISEGQAYDLQQAVRERALNYAKQGLYYPSALRRIWKYVNNACHTTKYRNIRAVDFETALRAANNWMP